MLADVLYFLFLSWTVHLRDFLHGFRYELSLVLVEESTEYSEEHIYLNQVLHCPVLYCADMNIGTNSNTYEILDTG